MKIVYKNGDRSYVEWINGIKTYNFVSKDGYKPVKIQYGVDGNKIDLAHEIGHILTAKYHNLDSNGTEYFRCEVMAWRVAKSFIKKEYWNESYAIECLKTHFDGKINWSKFRIIGWNK